MSLKSFPTATRARGFGNVCAHARDFCSVRARARDLGFLTSSRARNFGHRVRARGLVFHDIARAREAFLWSVRARDTL
jgi:hypothetical protein